MKNDWIICNTCEEEFRVVSDALTEVGFCPFCGSEIEQELDEDYEEE